jgi:nucleotide-binding universal stress UspA family protein
MFSKILIPLDGSKTAEKVLPYARYLAGRLKIPIDFLAVIDAAEMATQVSAENARLLDAMVPEATSSSEHYLRGIADTFAGGTVKCAVEKGRVEDVIIEKGEMSKGILISMATHGRSGLNRFLLGSIAEKVLRGTTNALLLVRATEQAKSTGEVPLKSIIVPLDGSVLAESLLPMVADMAKKLDLGIELFRAYHVPYNVYAGDDDSYAVINYDELIAGVRDEANEYLETKVAELKKLGVAKVSAVTKEGFAGDEIIAIGRKTPDSLIAMCSHGRSGVQRWMLGSVAETVVRHSGDPVLITRAPS